MLEKQKSLHISESKKKAGPRPFF